MKHLLMAYGLPVVMLETLVMKCILYLKVVLFLLALREKIGRQLKWQQQQYHQQPQNQQPFGSKAIGLPFQRVPKTNWRTSFRRAVITGSTHPRQATEWLADIEQAKSMQYLEDLYKVAPG